MTVSWFCYRRPLKKRLSILTLSGIIVLVVLFFSLLFGIFENTDTGNNIVLGFISAIRDSCLLATNGCFSPPSFFTDISSGFFVRSPMIIRFFALYSLQFLPLKRNILSLICGFGVALIGSFSPLVELLFASYAIVLWLRPAPWPISLNE